MRETIKSHATAQKQLFLEAKKEAESIFKGFDAREILQNPDEFVLAIRSAAEAQFVTKLLPRATQAGINLAVNLKKASNG